MKMNFTKTIMLSALFAFGAVLSYTPDALAIKTRDCRSAIPQSPCEVVEEAKCGPYQHRNEAGDLEYDSCHTFKVGTAVCNYAPFGGIIEIPLECEDDYDRVVQKIRQEKEKMNPFRPLDTNDIDAMGD